MFLYNNLASHNTATFNNASKFGNTAFEVVVTHSCMPLWQPQSTKWRCLLVNICAKMCILIKLGNPASLTVFGKDYIICTNCFAVYVF